MKNRILVPVAVLVFVLLTVLVFVYIPSKDADVVTVNKDGKTVKVIKLSDTKQPYTVELGGNTLYVERDGVSMTKADCPDKLCVRQGKIKSGAIICLPNKVSVEFENKHGGIDAVAGAR